MGFVHIESAPLNDCSSAVISFWFRIEQASVTAALNAFNPASTGSDAFGYWPPLVGVIPLVTFGISVPTADDPPYLGPSQSSPSFVGVDVTHGSAHPAVLATNLQMSNTATGQNDTVLRPDAYYMVGLDSRGLSPDNSGVMTGQTPPSPDSFIDVMPGKWHHVLISFDVSAGCSSVMDVTLGTSPGFVIKSWSYYWVAFDDVNYDRFYFAPSGGVQHAYIVPDHVPPGGLIIDDNRDVDANGITSSGVWNLRQSMSGSASLAGSAISINGQPLGVPSSANYVNSIYHCEMAELQFFAGIKMDTSILTNRRAFIGPKLDSKGNPMTGGLVPVDPAKAQLLLGRKPDILLHGSSKWIAGENTGGAGIGPDGKPLADGQFTPVGKIKKYVPDPQTGV